VTEPADQIRALNEQFYAADPAHYLRLRLASLLVLVDRPEDVEAMVRSGVSYAGVTLVAEANADDEADEDDDEFLRRYATAESQVLLHQTAEAVIRLFLAHADAQDCPWLEVAMRSDFGPFKRDVERWILAPGREPILRDAVARVFTGRQDTPPEGGVEWDRGVEHLVEFVRRFADLWLTDSRLYNSLKHGLAVIPSAALVLIDSQVMGDGPSLASLEYERRDGGVRHWSIVTRWIDLQESLALIEVGQQMIGALWAIARARYVVGSGEVPLYLPRIGPDQLRSVGRLTTRMSMPVLVTGPAPNE
jgi:hypothetical protein